MKMHTDRVELHRHTWIPIEHLRSLFLQLLFLLMKQPLLSLKLLDLTQNMETHLRKNQPLEWQPRSRLKMESLKLLLLLLLLSGKFFPGSYKAIWRTRELKQTLYIRWIMECQIRIVTIARERWDLSRSSQDKGQSTLTNFHFRLFRSSPSPGECRPIPPSVCVCGA